MTVSQQTPPPRSGLRTTERTPLQLVSDRWNAFQTAIQAEDLPAMEAIAAGDPDFLVRPPKHLQMKSLTVQVYNVDDFPKSFAWLWDRTAHLYPQCNVGVAGDIFRKAVVCGTTDNLQHLVAHYEALGQDPMGAMYANIGNADGRLLNIAVATDSLHNADWMLSRRPDLAQLKDLEGRNVTEFVGHHLEASPELSRRLEAADHYLKARAAQQAALAAIEDMTGPPNKQGFDEVVDRFNLAPAVPPVQIKGLDVQVILGQSQGRFGIGYDSTAEYAGLPAPAAKHKPGS